jgi:hypothetical protein
VLTAEQTSAIGRKYGLSRVAFFVALDQHGLGKVNSGIEIVKINFSNGRRRWKFRLSSATEFRRPNTKAANESAPRREAPPRSEGAMDGRTSGSRGSQCASHK